MAVVARSQAYPRPSTFSSMAVLLQEEDLPLRGRLEQPLPDASLRSPKDQNWQALQRRAAVCLRGRRHEFSSHGLCIRPAQACACRYPLLLWLGSLGKDSPGPHDEGTYSRPRFGCDLERQLPGCAGMLDTRRSCAGPCAGMHCSKRPRKEKHQ